MSILAKRPGTSAIITVALFACALTHAQDDIDFGDDSHPRANDGFCSDTRFTGEKALGSDGNRFETHQDATDCRALYEAGDVRCFGRRRCAEESRESQFRNLDVRRSLVADMTDGLATEDRAMIYVEPQQSRGETEFTFVNGTSVRNKQIVLIEPGTHRFGISWLSSTSGFSVNDSMVARALRSKLRFRADQEFEINLEAGKTYRVYPTRLVVSDASLVESPITMIDPGIRRTSESAETLAIWVVDADTGKVVVDQRDDYSAD